MRMLSEKELQKEFGISRTLSRKLRKNGLPYIVLGQKLIRYDYDKVSEYIDKTYTKEFKN